MSSEETRRDQILSAAGRVFGQYGFRKTSVGDIIREAGVSRATVYKYFSTKEEMFRAVIQREIRAMLEAVRVAVEGESTTRGRLRTAIVTHMEEIRRRANVYRLSAQSLSEVIPRTHEEAGQLAEEAVKLYKWILSEGVKAGEIEDDDIETTAWTIVLAFKGVFMTTLSGHIEERMPGVLDRLLDIIWFGLEPREEAV